MEFLSELWLPILLSAVAVFLASSVVHMMLQLHKSDFKKLPNEDAVMGSLRDLGVTPGEYYLPCAASMKEMGSPEMLKKFEAGPVAMMTVMPSGPPAMGKSLVIWFIYSLVISVFAAYLGYTALGPGADYLAAFRFTGTVAVLAYATSNVTNSIWKGSSWVTTFKYVFDGLLYGLVTAGVFGWLWPGA